MGAALGWGALSAASLVIGALLVMLVDSMIPEARRQFGRRAGLVTALGFAVAAAMSGLSA
jgi:zinc transporter ZupT